MVRQMRRSIVPFTFAVVLTVAAGLGLAEEHVWTPAEGPKGAVRSSDLSRHVAKPDGRGSDRKASASPSATGGPEQDGHRHAEHNIGAGSRALSEHDR